MAKFTDYTQKTKPADADLLLIHDNAGAANKKTPFSGVWSWILDKLASAVISQLETTNKSIIPAINELNSNALHFIYGSTRESDTINFEIGTSRATAVLVGNSASGDSYVGMIELNGSSASITKIAGSVIGTSLAISKDENTVSISVGTTWFLYDIMSTAEITIL